MWHINIKVIDLEINSTFKGLTLSSPNFFSNQSLLGQHGIYINYSYLMFVYICDVCVGSCYVESSWRSGPPSLFTLTTNGCMDKIVCLKNDKVSWGLIGGRAMETQRLCCAFVLGRAITMYNFHLHYYSYSFSTKLPPHYVASTRQTKCMLYCLSSCVLEKQYPLSWLICFIYLAHVLPFY